METGQTVLSFAAAGSAATGVAGDSGSSTDPNTNDNKATNLGSRMEEAAGSTAQASTRTTMTPTAIPTTMLGNHGVNHAVISGPVALPAPPLKTGDMWKLGHQMKTWKKRYFVLETGVLKYYVTRESSAQRSNPVNLRGLVATTETGKSGGCSFVHIRNAESIALPTDGASNGSSLEASDDYVLYEKIQHFDNSNAAVDSNHNSTEASSSSSPISPAGSQTVLMNDSAEFRTIVTLLLRFDNASTAAQWADAINRHIEYKNSTPVPVIHAGYMRKEGEPCFVSDYVGPMSLLIESLFFDVTGQYFKSWKTRYFILDKGVLSYFETHREHATTSASGFNRLGQMSLEGIPFFAAIFVC
jgi:hypothetical protein